MNSLAATWSQVSALIEAGYSLIPVRDKPENDRPAKSPYGYWKQYQNKIMPAAELFTRLERHDTTAVAVICGKISGNLEAVDVDNKWKPGIDGKLFKDIQTLYPNLWAKLRIHRSPSGGFHILYRIIDGPPGRNKHLAKRLTVPADNTDSKEVAFIETRGEGGYILMPPSLGYSIYKADPIPNITLAERNTIIALCESYNEVIKPAPIPKVVTKRENDYYDENPFEHFNRSAEAANVLIEYGWQPNKENSTFAWFSKPNSKSGERHASYKKEWRLYYFWTTATEFESGKWYSASGVMARLGFNGNFKALYQELVRRGYGRIKPAREAQLIKTAKVLPPNASAGALDTYNRRVRELTAAHPHGVFWAVEEGARVNIDREALYRVSGALGFRLLGHDIVLIRDNRFLFKVTPRIYFDAVKAYIKEQDDELYNDIVNTYEHFLQVAGQFTITRLPLLDDQRILKDDSRHAYKFFKSSWIKITAASVEEFMYDELPGYVWADRIMDREFIMRPNVGKYYDFLNKAIEFERIREHALGVIGFLAHEYKDESTAYIIVMTEQCPDPKQGGGSGKNLFCNMFAHVTTVATRPGEQIRYDERFFQSWNRQKIFVVSDAPKDFNFLFLKEITSGNAILKKLWRDEEEIQVWDLPKIIVNTNYSYEITDGGLKRRIIPLEFTDFFTRNGRVSDYYKAYFPRDFTEEDWAGFNYIMVTGIQTWLGNNLMLKAPSLTAGGWRKQFEQTYGHYTADFIYERIGEWLERVYIPNTEIKEQLAKYCEERAISKMYWPSIHKVNKAIEDYCHRNKVAYDPDVQRKLNGYNVKCKQFGVEDTPF